jgi:hypothetical protein
MPIKTAHEMGHFYSPVVDPDELRLREQQIWPANPECPGVDFNANSHETILREWFPRHMHKFNYAKHLPETANLTDFYICNSEFTWLDCRALFVFLTELKPRRFIEIGSGFSTLLTAHVNRTFLNNSMDFVCIEPFPRPFLKNRIEGISEFMEQQVQDVEFDVFDKLEAGDILFIDSSHVVKTGSDAQHIYLKILPRLKSGVIVHIHDIFLPNDYLKQWAIDENRSWNEQYIVQAMLAFSSRWEIMFGCSFAFHAKLDLVISALNHPKGHGFGGGSLWIKVV